MWDKLTREQKLEIIDRRLAELEIEIQEKHLLREVLEAEQLKLRLN